VDPIADLDAVVKRKICQLLPGLEPPIIQPVAQRYTTEPSRLLYFDTEIVISHLMKGMLTLKLISQ
jgi:hypothetical protein